MLAPVVFAAACARRWDATLRVPFPRRASRAGHRLANGRTAGRTARRRPEPNADHRSELAAPASHRGPQIFSTRRPVYIPIFLTATSHRARPPQPPTTTVERHEQSVISICCRSPSHSHSFSLILTSSLFSSRRTERHHYARFLFERSASSHQSSTNRQK